jgi:hypothetical protein
MNDILQHQAFLRDAVDRHQREAQGWARTGRLGRIAASAPVTSRGRSARLIGVVTPAAALFGLLAILI